MRAPIVVTLSALCVTGCAVEDDEIIGRYQVEWTRVESCGDAGVLASPSEMRFNVALRQGSDNSLQWIERGETLTLIDMGDGSYEAQVVQVFDARAGIEGAEELPACSIERLDTLTAAPDDEAATGDFETFSADLRFDYAAAADSSCGAFAEIGGLATDLPCSVVYEGAGARVE
jgi:hypothetical protein